MKKKFQHVLTYRHEKCRVPTCDKINYMNASVTDIHFELTNDKGMLSSKPLNHYEHVINPYFFARPYRTYILNIDNLKETSKGNSDSIVLFENNQKLYVSRDLKTTSFNCLKLS